MSSFFGGRDPFNDPFFSRPFGSSVFDSTVAKDPSGGDKSSGVIIEELDSDDERIVPQDKDNIDDVGKMNKQENKSAGTFPVIEHPDDQSDESANKSRSLELSQRTDENKVKGPQTRGISFQRVTYGGINGAYYTASTTRKSGKDGAVLEESREADTTTGEATHQISRGVHDKGHSVTRKLGVDGKVETMQTLHNLEEGELANFEKTWKGTADRHLPGWKHGFARNIGEGSGGVATGSGWQPFGARFSKRDDAADMRNRSNVSGGERPKKNSVNIPIE